jgi:Domain of unknown function (DUF4158)
MTAGAHCPWLAKFRLDAWSRHFTSSQGRAGSSLPAILVAEVPEAPPAAIPGTLSDPLAIVSRGFRESAVVPVDLDELVEHWTLLEDQRELVAGKRGPTRLAFALLLKFYARAGRFPRGRAELDDEAVAFVARQVAIPASDLGFYEWSGRTFEYHRAQVRGHLGFRECTAEDAAKLTQWLAVPGEPPVRPSAAPPPWPGEAIRAARCAPRPSTPSCPSPARSR